MTEPLICAICKTEITSPEAFCSDGHYLHTECVDHLRASPHRTIAITGFVRPNPACSDADEVRRNMMLGELRRASAHNSYVKGIILSDEDYDLLWDDSSGKPRLDGVWILRASDAIPADTANRDDSTNCLTSYDWIQIRCAANGGISGTSDEWPDLTKAIEKVKSGKLTRHPAAWLRGFCEALVLRESGVIPTEVAPPKTAVRRPTAWACRTCNKVDWEIEEECMARPEHVSYRGVDIGTCEGKFIPLYDVPCNHTWNPMDTAPKDGTRILLWDGNRVQVAAWSQGGIRRDGWRVEIIAIGAEKWPTYSVAIEEPIAWMPLPEPPETQAD